MSGKRRHFPPGTLTHPRLVGGSASTPSTRTRGGDAGSDRSALPTDTGPLEPGRAAGLSSLTRTHPRRGRWFSHGEEEKRTGRQVRRTGGESRPRAKGRWAHERVPGEPILSARARPGQGGRRPPAAISRDRERGTIRDLRRFCRVVAARTFQSARRRAPLFYRTKLRVSFKYEPE